VKLSELMNPSGPAVSGGATAVGDSSKVENVSGGQYSDQFSTVPHETLSHLWERKCRKLSQLLLKKPKVEVLLNRHVSTLRVCDPHLFSHRSF
jgi:hypothetical protein